MDDAIKISDALLAANIPFSGMSWGDFNLFGDDKSIAEAKRLQHLAGQREALVTEIQTTRALAKQRGEALVALEKIYAERLADLTAEKARGNLTADFGEAGLRNTTVFLDGTIDFIPDIIGSLGFVDMSANVTTTPAKGLRMLLEGHYFLPQRIEKKSFGTEVDFTVWWRDAVPFELSGGVSVFMPGDPLKARLGDGSRVWAYLAGQWDF